jgi:hypothetical protein
MKTIDKTTVEVVEITPAKIEEIKLHINTEWNTFYTSSELTQCIMSRYIFGPYGISEHYSSDFISNLVNEVAIELTPIVEEVVNTEIV